MPATVTLIVTKGAMTGQEFVFGERGTSIIGRSKDCSPRLPDDDNHRTVSRHHCLVDVNPPDIRIRDFGSRNGTYVNGAKIGQRAKGQGAEDAAGQDFPEHDLVDGDEVRVGQTAFLVSVRHPTNPAHAMESTVHAEAAPGKVDPAAQPPADPDELLRRLLDRAKAARRAGRDAMRPRGGVEAIEGYAVLRQLGRGGMGAVYLARDERTGREVALKVMLPRAAASAHARARFVREVELTTKLRHDNIATVHDVGDSEGFFFTVEYCQGGSLDQFAERRGGTVGVDEAAPLILQTLHGLQHAHSQGIVHRDLSPQNILLGGSASIPVAKICDFGIAKAFDQAGLSGLTRTGTAGGKPLFIPRQQVVNFKDARPEVDVWAAAASLYWLLTGTTPRDFTAGKDVWQVVLQDAAVPIRQRTAAVPRRLAEVIDEALEDDPEIGFRNAAAFRRALERAV